MTLIGRLLRRDPYLWFAVIMFALLLYFVVSQPWHIDLGMHLATVVRWRAELSEPRNPLIDVPGPSPYYSPYMLCWVLLSLTFGWTQFTVLKIAAALNVILLLAGVRVFAGCFTRSRAAMILGWFAILLIWGVEPTLWSGLYPLGTLLVSLPFPSTFATGCALILMGLVRGTAVRDSLPSRRRLAVIIGLATAIILSHPIVAAATALSCVVLLLEPITKRPDARRIGIWLGVGLLSVLLAALWPWFSIADLLATPDGLDELHRKLYEDWPLRYGLLFGTVPALIMRAIRKPRDPLLHLAAVNLAVVITGYLTGHYAMGRMITWAAIPAQLATAIELTRLSRELYRRRLRPWSTLPLRAAVLLISVGTLVAGTYSQLGVARSYLSEAATRSWPSAIVAPYTLFGDYSWAADRMRYGDVVLTADRYAVRMIPGYGMYTVQPAYPDPLLPDALPNRRAITDEFLESDTDPKRRTAIVTEYSVDWVIADPEEWRPGDRPLDGIDFDLVATGPHGERLYRVQ